MQDFFSSLATGFGVLDIIDIAIIAFIIYKALGFIRESRAEQIVARFQIFV
jgi:diadenylate cyclase